MKRLRVLSSIFALILSLSTFGVTSVSAEEAVASIGDKTFGSLPDAFAAAKDGDTIELLSDIAVDTAGSGGRIKCFAPGAKITLKGNGHKITSKADVAIAFHHDPSLDQDNGGTAEITVKELTVENTAASGSGAAVQTNTGTSVFLENCSIYSNGSNTVGSIVVQTNSALTLKGNSIVAPKSGAAIRLNGAAARAYIYESKITADYAIDAANAASSAAVGHGAVISLDKTMFTNTVGTSLTVIGGSISTSSARSPVIEATSGGFKVAILGGSFEGGLSIYRNNTDKTKNIKYPDSEKKAVFSMGISSEGIKFAENSSGMRFVSEISPALAELAKAQNETDKPEYGTVICPADYLAAAGGTFDLDALGDISAPTVKKFVKIPGDIGMSEGSDGVVGLSAALVNIKPENYARDYVAACYVAITFGGEKIYSYSAPVSANIEELAYAALSDVAGERSEEYPTEVDSYFKKDLAGYTKVDEKAYSPYNGAKLRVLDNYIKGIKNFEVGLGGDALGETSASIPAHTSDIFRTLGRTYQRNGGIACDFTCTGVRFNAYCEGEIYMRLHTSADTYFTVYIDGERSDDRIYAKSSTAGWLTVATDIPRGDHEIMIVKQSQFTMSQTELREIKISGEFKEIPAERELFVEFYGDSIVNGSNVYLGGTSAKTSDGTMAFGWLAAEAIGADCNIIGCGGLGLSISGSDFVMGDIYDLNGSLKVSGVTKYDFARIPDAVVIELGVNDQVRGADVTVYKTKARKMIEDLRAKYGEDVPIIWLTGYHDKDFFTNTLSVITELGGESANLYTYKTDLHYLTASQGGDGYHPDVKHAKAFAAEVAECLRQVLGISR